MKNKLSYKEAFDLITEAYIRNKIKPLNSRFCFCGTLAGNTKTWRYDYESTHFPYTFDEYRDMEDALFEGINAHATNWAEGYDVITQELPNMSEEALFNGMCKALDKLKEIHIARGEDVDEQLSLTKRELVTI